MDTIIYFYKKRDLAKPVIDTQIIKDTLLVRVGMNVGENKWFFHSIAPYEAAPDAAAPKENMPVFREELKRRILPYFLRGLFGEWKKRLRRARDFRRLRKLFRQERTFVCREIEAFLSELDAIVDQRYQCQCVYGDAVRKSLLFPEDDDRGAWTDGTSGGKDRRQCAVPAYWLPQLWRQYWQIPEFNDYLQPQWAELLLDHALPHHFVILGTAPCAPSAVLHCAGRMKSLRWIISEQDCTEELQDFVDDFYEEYGLAAALQLLEGGKAFARLLLESREPVCILDFTGEKYISPGGAARGSVWIDFLSVEEKARRIMERGEGISYFSLKEMWKRAGKP